VRALIASTEGSGHFGPLIPFVEALKRRGDEVLIVGPPGLGQAAKVTGARFEGGAAAPAEELASTWRQARAANAKEASVLVNREIFGRLNTAAMLPTLERVCEQWHPEVILREPCEYASGILAERSRIPHAQVAISLAQVEEGSLELAAPALEPYREGIVERLRAVPYLTRFPGSLDPSPFPRTIRFCEQRVEPGGTLPKWWGADERPLLYATLGSLAGARPIASAIFGALVDAVATLPVRVLLTTGNDFDPAQLPALPPNVHVEPWVAQRQVLLEAAVVVCHGGSGTAFGALSAGIPLVIVPLFADQPVNARLIASAGAGIALEMDADGESGVDCFAKRVREAIGTALSDPRYRAAASAIATEMRTTPSLEEVLDALLGGDQRSDRGPID
jgi:UDP:flavonoid glycosyltransferase YjiC (YdhE family)